MSAVAAAPYILLSPAYRHAQRATARWVEDGRNDTGRTRFALRAAWAALEATERDRLLRWLAWLCVAATSHGDTTLMPRLQRMDAKWGPAITRIMRNLPGYRSDGTPRERPQRLSA